MQTNVTQTSLYAYNEFVRDKSELTQSEIILDALKGGANTANLLSRVTGFHSSKISARLNLLKEKGIVQKTGEKITDKVTGVPNEVWEVVNNKMEVVK